MAVSDLSFKLYTDVGLTTSFTGLYQLSFKSDLSDSQQDMQLWFGSNTASRILQTTASPGTNPILLTPTDISTKWTAGGTAFSLGNIIEPTVANGYIYICTTAGTGASVTEPTWPTAISSTVIDGTAVWTCYAPRHPTTEIKLATTSGGLSSATAGAALSLGTSLSSGVSNAVNIWIRVTNTITTINNNTGYPTLGININSVQEIG